MKIYFLSIIAVLILFSCKESDKQTTIEVVTENSLDDDSPSIPVYDYNGLETAYFKQENNTTYVINFWATWCKPCVKELPAFEQLNENYKESNVEVVLVSLDFPEKLKTGVIPFIEKYNLQSEVVLLDDADANTWIPKVSEQWSGAIPATVIINNQKKSFYERSFTYEELETELKTFIN